MLRSRKLIYLAFFLSVLGCGKSSQTTESPSALKIESKATTPTVNANLKPQKNPLTLHLKLNDPGVNGPLIPELTQINQWLLIEGSSVWVDQNQLIQPIKAGHSRLEAKASDGQTQTLEVDVAEPEGIDFSNDIVPILTRQGCNSGGCHGRLDGQNGFKLSLFGYAPSDDYLAIVRGGLGRRIDRINPQESLFLKKATGQVPHGGGQVLATTSADFHRLLRWVKTGALESSYKKRSLKSLRLVPDLILAEKPASFQVHAFVEFDDGSSRDVSSWATWRTLDDRIASIDAFGRGSALEPGETHLVVRFGTLVQTLPVRFSGTPLLSGSYDVLDSESNIDILVAKHLKSLQIAPSGLADDATYLRRVTLDLVGRLPEPAEIRRFVKDQSPEKRSLVVAGLLEDADFQKFWSLKLGDLLQASTARQGNAAAFYLLWIQDQLSKELAWDKMVRALLTTRGDPSTRDQAAASYSLVNVDPVLASQLTAQRLLGVRMRCAQCHDHPFDVWTQTQAHSFAAFFAKVRPTGPTNGQMMARPQISYFPQGEVRHPRTGALLSPQVFYGKQPEIKPDSDPLPALADWMTSPENPLMARAFVNWLWSQFFATGLVDPVDDLSAANPPSHPEVLEALSKRFQELNYQIKPMITEILKSRVYQLSSKPISGNQLFSRLNAFQAPRPLTAQQLADALAKSTGVPNRFNNKPTGTRAVEIQDPAVASSLLDTLGRCDRTEICSSSSPASSLNLRQSLIWIGSDTVDAKVGALSGYVRQLLDLQPEPEEIIENLYLRTLCRYPSADESKHWSRIIQESDSQPETVEDIFWALLNSREFLFNH